MKIIPALIFMLLAGCATAPTATSMAESGNYEGAYNQLLGMLTGAQESTVERARKIADQYPQVVEYGASTFAVERLSEWTARDENLNRASLDADKFCKIAAAAECESARANITKVRAGIKPSILVIREIYEQLGQNEKDQVTKRFNVSLVDADKIGIVADRQVQNIGTPGSRAGSDAGALIGSAIYVNNAIGQNSVNYSVAGNIGAGIVGGVIGAAANIPPEVKYLTRYTVKSHNGKTKQVDAYSETPIGFGIGVCVNTGTLTQVSDSLCTMTVGTLRAELGR